MSDVVTHEFYNAQKDFFTKEECERLIRAIEEPNTLTECDDLLARVAKAAEDWNNQSLKFNVDFTKPVFSDWSGVEASQRVVTVPDHAIHIGNIKNPMPYKWSVIVNVGDRDDIQGGELVFRTWPPAPYKDNFGEWKGDPNAPSQPEWINEQGTIVIFPSMAEHGNLLVTSGTAHRVKIRFAGPQFI